MNIGILYGGQGSQVSGMGYDFYENEKIAKEFYDSIKLDKDVMKISFESSDEEIRRTDNTQVILISYEIMITKLLEENGIIKSAVAGLSIGEYGALYASGVLSEIDALRIAEFRGREMAIASDKYETEMYAVIGMDEVDLFNICEYSSSENSKVYISNLNTKGQVVISGGIDAARCAVKKIEDLGKKAVKLNVHGAFHTEYMSDVCLKLSDFFKKINYSNPKVDVYYNLLGDKNYENLDLKEIMSRQVKECVRFEDVIRNMIDDGIDTFIEIGYGNIISGFIRRINKNIKVYSISNYESYLKTIEEIKND